MVMIYRSEESQCPEENLATAILKLAVDDARRGKLGARLWFEFDTAMLSFWADVIGANPDTIRNKVLAMVPPVSHAEQPTSPEPAAD